MAVSTAPPGRAGKKYAGVKAVKVAVVDPLLAKVIANSEARRTQRVRRAAETRRRLGQSREEGATQRLAAMAEAIARSRDKFDPKGIGRTKKEHLGDDFPLSTLRKLIAASSGVDRHKWVSEGVSTGNLKTALAWFQDTPEKQLLDSIGISQKTIGRKENARLNPHHSDAALALIEITIMAEKALGSKALAEEWLNKPALALDGARPLDMLTSTPGIEAVKDLLQRIEYGVYA